MNVLLDYTKRYLLYQLLIYFSLSKINNIIDSEKELFCKLNILIKDLGFNDLIITKLSEDDDTIFRIILISIITFAVLSIFNFTIMKFISGLISIAIGFIYYNPFTKLNELKSNKKIIINMLLSNDFLPSIDLFIYIGSGIAMIYQSFENFDFFYYIFCCFCNDEWENKRKRKNKKKCKINCQFEYDINSN